MDTQEAVRMDNSVIPSGYGVSCFFLCRVPRGGDVGLGAVKDRQRLDVFEVVLQKRIISCEMTSQGSEGMGL